MFIETINDCLDIKMKPDQRLKTYADDKIHISRRCFLKRKSTHYSNMVNYSALVLLLATTPSSFYYVLHVLHINCFAYV